MSNLKDDINEYKNIVLKDIKIKDSVVNIELEQFDKNIIKKIEEWITLLQYMKKSHILCSNYLTKIYYCLLSDCCIVNKINNHKIKVELYDTVFNKFQQFQTINENERLIKINIFKICNELIIFDCKNIEEYKIYKIYDLCLLKEIYGEEVNMDKLIKEIKLTPIFTGNINRLSNDFKKLSYKNMDICKKYGELINLFDIMMTNNKKMETKIKTAYNKFYKSLY